MRRKISIHISVFPPLSQRFLDFFTWKNSGNLNCHTRFCNHCCCTNDLIKLRLESITAAPTSLFFLSSVCLQQQVLHHYWVFRILKMHHRDTGILLPMDYHKLTTRQITRSNAQQYVKISVVCWVYVNRETNHLCFWNLSKTVNFSPCKLAALPKLFSLQSLTNIYAINIVDRMLLHDSKKTEIREDACGYSHCPTIWLSSINLQSKQWEH